MTASNVNPQAAYDETRADIILAHEHHLARVSRDAHQHCGVWQPCQTHATALTEAQKALSDVRRNQS